MLREIYEYYYEKNRKQEKGYHIIGKKWSIVFCLFGILTIFDAAVLVITSYSILFIPLALLMIGLYYVFKKINDILLAHEIKTKPDKKDYILKFLRTELKFNHSSQLKELALQFETYGEKSKKSFNLLPYLNLIIPVLVLLLTFIYQDFSTSLELTIKLVIAFFMLSIALHILINAFAEIFINTKAERMLYLASLLNEMYLEQLISEHEIKEQQPTPQSIIIYNSKSLF